LYVLHYYNKVKFKYLLWDTWFSSKVSSKENFEYVHYELKKYFIAALKSNRLVALSMEQKRAGKFRRLDGLDIQKDQVVEIYIKGLDFPVRLIKLIFTNKDGSTGELYVVTNLLILLFLQPIKKDGA
jgi:hypothetical protein